MIKHPKQDSNYIAHFNNTFSISPIFSFKNYKFTISDQWGIGNPIDHLPNVTNRIGIKARYKDYGLGITFALPSNEYIYGKTKSNYLSLNTQLAFLNWGVDLYFLRHQGFYIENASAVVNNWINGTPFPFRPDLKITNIGVNTHMVFSDRFSLKAALQQTEKQLKTAGGITIGSLIQYSRMAADSTFIPLKLSRFYKDLDSLTSISYLTLALAPGYSLTYVKDDFFVTGMVLLGAQVHLMGYKNEGPTGGLKIGIDLSSYLNYRFAFGYNTDKYFGSIVYSFINNKVDIQDSKFTISQKGITLQAGMRFK